MSESWPDPQRLFGSLLSNRQFFHGTFNFSPHLHISCIIHFVLCFIFPKKAHIINLHIYFNGSYSLLLTNLLQIENNHENIYIIIEGNILISYPHKTIFFSNIPLFGKC